MEIIEFFNQIIELAQSGNWAGIWTLVLTVGATVLASVGGITGIIALMNIVLRLLSNKRLITGISSNVNTAFVDTQRVVSTLVGDNVTKANEALREELKAIKGDNKALIKSNKQMLNQLTTTQQSFQSFVDTVLDTDTLKLMYENKIKEFALSNVVEEVEEIEEIIEQVAEEAVETVVEQAKEEKKKIKLKKEKV